MAYKKYRPSLAANLLHLAQALLLERYVPHSQHFIDNQNLRFKMGGDSEGETHVHTGRVPLHRGVQKGLDLGEGYYLVELAPDLLPAHAEDGAV